VKATSIPRAAAVTAGRPVQAAAQRLRTERDWLASRRARADLALFHEFLPPPTGGGSQFLRALTTELRGRGLSVEVDRISGSTPVCLYNSFNFDFARLRRFARPGCRMVHRVDGPIGVYRGFDDGTDRRIARINAELADATVVQSRFSLEEHLRLGLQLREPTVIPNAVDPAVFHPPASRAPLAGRRLRLIATSWSDNPNKGADVFAWLDRNLDRSRYELTFVGRSPVAFEHARNVGAVTTEQVAELLRLHDAYIAASRNDPCSNALLEALASGLPAAYLDSGGHPELVREGGLPFSAPEELPEVLGRLAAELEERRAAIRVPALGDVADRYLAVLFPTAALP
jgi:glycosyltransferase involved in cell wall biosynthesis